MAGSCLFRINLCLSNSSVRNDSLSYLLQVIDISSAEITFRQKHLRYHTMSFLHFSLAHFSIIALFLVWFFFFFWAFPNLFYSSFHFVRKGTKWRKAVCVLVSVYSCLYWAEHNVPINLVCCGFIKNCGTGRAEIKPTDCLTGFFFAHILSKIVIQEIRVPCVLLEKLNELNWAIRILFYLFLFFF